MRVSSHAITRYRERVEGKTNVKTTRNDIINIIKQKAVLAEFSHPKYAVFALLNHDFERAEYFIYKSLVFVVVDGCVKTVHRNESKRWKPIKDGK